jgi:predicted RNase H-like nuclease (RuvC/YqgF family)
MSSIELKNNKEVYDFCMKNGITDINKFTQDCFKQGFDIKKYGFLGETLNEGEKHLKTGGIEEKRVEIEVIREIRVEVPVEVIKEVEKIVELIKEVPVDRVVEKIIYTTDNIQINELGGKITKLEEEISTKTTEIGTIKEDFSTKTTEMENIFQNRMSKKDEELDELRRKLDDPVTNNKLNMLQDTLQNLRNDLSLKNDKINELEKINKELQRTANLQNAIYMKGSNLNSRI